MKSKNWQEPAWELLRTDDHRTLLKKVLAAKGAVDVVYQLCSPWLHLIVEELHFGSQKTSALTLLPNEVVRITKEYIAWLKEESYWQALDESWSTQSQGPWSIPLFLATIYQEFTVSQYPDLSGKESSLSFKKALIEYSHKSQVPPSRVVGAMAEQIVESFSAWTNSLPEPLRLCYQLHLEGLVEPEIGLILDLSADQVSEKIREAKGILGFSQNEAI